MPTRVSVTDKVEGDLWTAEELLVPGVQAELIHGGRSAVAETLARLLA
jgi:hypothetical protein